MSKLDTDEYNVVPDRPPSLDEQGFRLFIIPANVKGYFRNLRNYVYGVLIFIFLVIPWTTFNGRQTIWLNISERKFIFFDTVFFAHDGPLIFFLLALAAFSIIFMTALYGRVWCGWACPQTVFIDFVYRRIEEWTEGDYLKRRKMDKQDMTPNILFRKSIKWFLYFVVSSHIAHSFTAYFVGSKNLVWITLGSPYEHWGLFIWVQIFTLILLVDFGWFREQFCLIACPYGRFQSALMDKNSLAILYDYNRGEPRKQKGMPAAEQGDCINCLRCVNVCPTGIDIRNGLQMECIACTACADACDEIMDKVKKPKGLIRYGSEAELQGQKRKKLTLRNVVYALILFLLTTGAIWSIRSRNSLEVKLVRAIETPYQFAGKNNEMIVNHFRLHVTNQTNDDLSLQDFTVDSVEVSVVSPNLKQIIKPGKDQWIHIFFTFPAGLAKEGFLSVNWELAYDSGGTTELRTGLVKFLAPKKEESTP